MTTDPLDLARLRECIDSLREVQEVRRAGWSDWHKDAGFWVADYAPALLAKMPTFLTELTRLREQARAADMFRQLVVGEDAWERFSELNTRAESAEARLRELKARMMGAPVVKVDGVIRYADGSVSVLTNPKLTDPVLRPLMGRRVRLVVEGGEDE